MHHPSFAKILNCGKKKTKKTLMNQIRSESRITEHQQSTDWWSCMNLQRGLNYTWTSHWTTSFHWWMSSGWTLYPIIVWENKNMLTDYTSTLHHWTHPVRWLTVIYESYINRLVQGKQDHVDNRFSYTRTLHFTETVQCNLYPMSVQRKRTC